MGYQHVGGLQVDSLLLEFVNTQVLPGTGVDQDAFWFGFEQLISDLSPINQALLQKRDQLQHQLDEWHQQHRGSVLDSVGYKTFLQEIGYLTPTGEPFSISTSNVDDEIALIAGPQLVVPVMNARFALNACNARWGSLYDALYGTDVIDNDDGAAKTTSYNARRGAKVIAYGRSFLDDHFPLSAGSYSDATSLRIADGLLVVTLADGRAVMLSDEQKFRGFQGPVDAPSAVLLRNNRLHVEIVIDKSSPIGGDDPAGISDIVIESALTTIMDCEDSVAAVDAADKVLVYRNWLGLMTGELQETVSKNGKRFVRSMAADRHYTDADGSSFTVPGRSLLFVRNVGHLMTSAIVLDRNGQQIPEGILDGVITSLAAMHDLGGTGPHKNSRTGSVYIVKPKMHGPDEVAFTCTLFSRIETLLGLTPLTLKVGIMDEERRTSVNLAECIRAAKERVVFINTGFLDRTGDEIHTSMEAGAFVPKGQMKNTQWIQAYETGNVAVGLACGLHGKAQIGKGMWAMPDEMAAMLKAKIAQLQSGANTAWVPSPTAATLHALHYHAVDVDAVQKQLCQQLTWDLDEILTLPLLGDAPISEQQIQAELENNAQGILGYVVRWIDQGVGCSKVPDNHNVQLMEDRATLRISSQHIANWIRHGICSEQQVIDVFKMMAAVVDQQNAHDSGYVPMENHLDNNLAFKTALDLVLLGREQPNGYTEPLLHAYRQLAKSRQSN